MVFPLILLLLQPRLFEHEGSSYHRLIAIDILREVTRFCRSNYNKLLIKNQYKSNKSQHLFFWLLLILLLGGDIESNPGPGKQVSNVKQ